MWGEGYPNPRAEHILLNTLGLGEEKTLTGNSIGSKNRLLTNILGESWSFRLMMIHGDLSSYILMTLP